MAKLSGKEIQKLARSIVIENPGGIRYSVLVEKISQQNPETPKNTIHGAVRWVTIIFLRCGKPVLLVEPLCTLPFTNFVPSWPFLNFVPFIVKTPR